MEKKAFDAVSMTRRIRDAHAKLLENASPKERIRFYREEARRVHGRLGRDVPRSDSAPPS